MSCTGYYNNAANKHLKKDGESGQTEKKFMFLLPFDIRRDLSTAH